MEPLYTFITKLKDETLADDMPLPFFRFFLVERLFQVLAACLDAAGPSPRSHLGTVCPLFHLH